MAAVAVAQLTDAFKDKVSLTEYGSQPRQPTQPDIGYHPDDARWKARTARRLAEDPSLPETPLPEGFPAHLDSPLVWEGEDWTDEKQWTYDLSTEHLKEIDDAVKHFKSLNKPLGLLSPETFPLPTLSPALKSLAKELYTGRGFFVLRTLPVDSYSRADILLIYAGVSSHIAPLRAVQDASNNSIIAHIKDLTKTVEEGKIGAPAYTTEKQVYHTDVGDVISLLALETAPEGGRSWISSAWRVYNELAEKRPDLIKTLAEDWAFDNFGSEPPYSLRPLLYHKDSHIIIQYARRLFTGYWALPRSEGIPPITEAQAEALDALHFLAEKHALGLDFKKGDIQYINNLSIFHARDAFTDTDDKARHLVRLWLRNEELAWPLPEALEPVWKRLYYTSKPEDQRFPLEPEIRQGSKGLKRDGNKGEIGGGEKYA
ncbi:hypothetical protein AX16_010982 [Volvariella volvacea WC 439]|nr:hypothetical protein AX16_010982 [Volvariella volvacea WC 439]